MILIAFGGHQNLFLILLITLMKTKLFILLLCIGTLFFSSCSKNDPVLSSDLTVTISSSDLTLVVGTDITFTIVAHNNGPDNASGVDVTNNLPTGYTIVSTSATVGTVADRKWTIGSLANGASATLTMVVTVLPTGIYPHAVSILGIETDPSTLNNSSLVTVVPKTGTTAKVTFNNDIKPLVTASCTPCHVTGGTQPKKWDVYATAKANISAMIDRVSRAQGAPGFMPNGGTKLSDADIALLKQWVTDGLLEK
jgi:uncharacterized repeat protein (TIGR01451 family)